MKVKRKENNTNNIINDCRASVTIIHRTVVELKQNNIYKRIRVVVAVDKKCSKEKPV